LRRSGFRVGLRGARVIARYEAMMDQPLYDPAAPGGRSEVPSTPDPGDPFGERALRPAYHDALEVDLEEREIVQRIARHDHPVVFEPQVLDQREEGTALGDAAREYVEIDLGGDEQVAPEFILHDLREPFGYPSSFRE